MLNNIYYFFNEDMTIFSIIKSCLINDMWWWNMIKTNLRWRKKKGNKNRRKEEPNSGSFRKKERYTSCQTTKTFSNASEIILHIVKIKNLLGGTVPPPGPTWLRQWLKHFHINIQRSQNPQQKNSLNQSFLKYYNRSNQEKQTRLINRLIKWYCNN